MGWPGAYRQCELSGVTRDDLSDPVHPGPRSVEERTPGVSAPYARHAPLSSSHAEDTQPRPNRRYRLHQRTPCHGGGSGGTRSLGRGPAVWQQEQSDATLVERQSRYVMLLKLSGKDTETVTTALIKSAHKLPQELYKSLTWDRGKEMADHKSFTLATDIQVYFCDPHHPWQRGTNENTSGLLRQYFPKGIDLSAYSQAKLNAIARRLNERPRKTLNHDTPAERFHQTVASTG